MEVLGDLVRLQAPLGEDREAAAFTVSRLQIDGPVQARGAPPLA
jgi:hypothetical protein